MKKSWLLLLFGLSSYVAITQESTNLLKVFPDPTTIQSAPEWAKLMYSENPRIYEVIDAYEEYYQHHEYVKTIHTQNYKRWARMAERKLNEAGHIVKRSKYEQDLYFQRLKEKVGHKNASHSWKSIGPFETYKNGTTTPYSNHANIYSLDQAPYNDQKLICGTEGGGVFLTLDKAATWSLITKNEVFANGITAVAFHPTNQNTFYVGANSRLYKSEDGGSTWAENLFTDGVTDEIKFDPNDTDHIYLATSKGLFESTDGAINWTQVFTDRIWDLDFHVTNSDLVYLLKSNPNLTKSEFLKSTNNGATWEVITNGWYVPEVAAEASENGGKIGVSPDDSNRVYVALIGSSKANDNGWIGIYRSDDSGDSWHLPSGQVGGPYESTNTMPWNAAAYSSGYHQGYYNFDMEVSPDDADLLWFGTVRLSESSDGGASYISIGAANSQRLSDIHADIQAIHVSDDDIWIASDGGINYSNDKLLSHSSKKYGIIGSEFWGFGAGWNHDILVGGKYHNGNTVYYDNYGLGLTHNVGGVEESTGYVNPFNNKNAYFNQYWSGYTISKIIADQLGGSTTNSTPIYLIPNESYFTSYSSGIYHDPLYSNQMIAGKDSMIYQSMDGGSSWEILHDFGKGRVLELEISRHDRNVIYAVFQPGGGYWDWCKLYKTIDGGRTWTELTEIPTNNRRRFQITTNPMDKDEIWVSAVIGGDGQKIYKSTDGGTVWTNETTATLDGQEIVDLRFHGGSTDVVYAVSNTGFYYHENGVWINYGSDLPKIINPLSMDLFYRDQKIRLATKGRGIWEIDMPVAVEPQAHAIAQTDSIFCSRDTIQLESHSIVDQTNTTWLWSISPTPSYLSDPTLRNPKVRFAESGEYDVSLTVTNDLGLSSTIIHEKMFFLENQCDVDTFSGLAARMDSPSEFIQLPNLGVTTNNFTISAWVKPEGIQPEYAGILINDGSAVAGLNFRESNNTLGYHWPGGAWWWDSGLEVPADEWSHIALVATPLSLTVYLNGEGVTHTTNLDPVLLESMKIGSYRGWTSRNFKGAIDEVAVWNRSLSTEEIRSHRHLTKEHLTSDPDFLAYYQFNQETSKVLDKINTRHGSLSSGVTFEICPAPLGGGASDHHFINSAGTYTFVNASSSLELGSGTYPDGDVYMTRINSLPQPLIANNENIGSYWIINNYGDKSFTASSTLKLDDPYTSPSGTATQNTSLISLIRRAENDFLETWSEQCQLNNVDVENYVFSSCNLGGEGQFFLFSNCLPSATITTDYGNGTLKSIHVINSLDASNTLEDGSNIIFNAGQIIRLNPEFEVRIGGVLTANMDDCGN